MGAKDTVIKTVTCDGPDCTKHSMFDGAEPGVLEKPEHVWLKSHRLVRTADGRQLLFCSDICEVNSIKTGLHNAQEAPKVVGATNQAAIALAAQAAANAKLQDAAIRSGQPAKVQLS